MSRPTPMMFDHAVKVYNAMQEEAIEESLEPEGELVKVYTGHLTSLFQKLELAQPYYTAVMKGLKALNCVEQMRRGGGTSPSKWILFEAPFEEAWVAYEDNKRSKAPQGKVPALEQKVQNLLERVQRLEDLQEKREVA